jgi:hypothetical protein
MVRQLAVLGVLAVLVSGLSGPAARAQSNAFDAVWATTDRAVADGNASYSWFWGPQVLLETHEVYADSPEDERAVRYYDKSRMEINDPGSDPSSIYYVTNGLLASELVTGQLQYTDGDFEQRAPATLPIAGDPAGNPGTPSYAEMAPYTTTDGVSHRASNREGQEVIDFLDGSGQLSATTSSGVRYTQYQPVTGHNVADVFWNWSHDPASGLRPDEGVDWLYVLGYPTSEPYWVDSTVGTQPRRVLVQMFERRVLTYTADNPEPYKIEYGNIGQHYFRWRYKVSEAASIPTQHTVAFTASVGQDVEVMTLDLASPGTPVNLTAQQSGIDGVPYWSPTGTRIALARGGMGDGFALTTVAADGSDPRAIAPVAHGFFGWSSDGQYLAYRTGAQVVVVNETTLETIPAGPGRVATWSPNTRELLVTDENSTRVNRVDALTGQTTEIARTTGGAFVQDLAWLRGGKYAAVLDNAGTGVSCVHVFTVPTATTDIGATCSNTASISTLRASADHTQVAYVLGSARVQVVDATGAGRVRDLDFEAEGSGETVITGLDWSYSPSELVVGARRGGSSALYAVEHDNAGQRRLTDPAVTTAIAPSVSPAR